MVMIMVISIYKLDNVSISRNLIGSLSLANGQYPLPKRLSIFGVKQMPSLR